MEVKEVSSESFWKGEVRIRGMVEDGGKTYRASVYLKSSQIFDYSCSCERGNSYRGMCGHCQALLGVYRETEERGQGRSVSTSASVRYLIREYTNREVARIMGEGEAQKVRLVPKLLIDRRGVRISCRVGRGRLYQIKDMEVFAQAVEQGSYVEYGKGLAFNHSIHAFTEESEPLLRLILDLAGAYRQHDRQAGREKASSSPRSLLLNRAGCDRLFAMLQGGGIEAEDSRGRIRQLLVRSGNPSFSVEVKREGRDGARVSVPEELLIFCGERNLYVADQKELCRCGEDYSEAMTVFLEQMIYETGGSCDVLVNERDLPLFYERVLRKFELLGILREHDLELEKERPEELKAVFAFDSAGPDGVTLTPTLSYGDFSFHPLEDETVPRRICRDVPGEFRVSQLITRYFQYREDGTKNLVIQEDPDAVYRLLDEGMEQFRALGTVYLSEAFHALRVLPPPSVSIGASLNGGWLELSVEAGDLSGAELVRVLSEYAKKKKYYRMKSGEFLKLGDDGLLTVAKLAEGLAVTKGELQSRQIRLPAFRALYLDSLMKESGQVEFCRDQSFRSVIRGMKSAEDSNFEIPGEVRGVLREYQKIGYRWLRTLDFHGFGGILADDMGLGKTLQMISVLLGYYGGGREGDGGVFSAASSAESRAGASSGQPLPSLVVCPASLVYNWCHEFAAFAPSLRVTAVTGTAGERRQLLSRIGEFQVVITSYDLLKRDLEEYRKLHFRYEVLDEAQFIKNAATQSARAVKSVRAVNRFALTGTPVENRLGELWSIFDFLMPGFLFGCRKFRDMFELPIVRDGDRAALENLHRMISPFVLRRLKSDVLRELPEKLERTVYSAFEGKQRELYTANALQLKKLLEGGAGGPERFQILAELTRLRQICCDPSLCYDNYDGGSAKLETCIDLISGAAEAGHKVLLFSQFSSMLEIIRKRLDRERIASHLLTGSTTKEERNRLVQVFQGDEVPVFLISLKAGGTGLNLTAADIVIHYDPWWNAAAQNQATDRAHRIGQERQVTVYKLIMKETVEENILKLQEAKNELASQVVTEGMVSLSGIDREELIRILGV